MFCSIMTIIFIQTCSENETQLECTKRVLIIWKSCSISVKRSFIKKVHMIVPGKNTKPTFNLSESKLLFNLAKGFFRILARLYISKTMSWYEILGFSIKGNINAFKDFESNKNERSIYSHDDGSSLWKPSAVKSILRVTEWLSRLHDFLLLS